MSSHATPTQLSSDAITAVELELIRIGTELRDMVATLSACVEDQVINDKETLEAFVLNLKDFVPVLESQMSRIGELKLCIASLAATLESCDSPVPKILAKL